MPKQLQILIVMHKIKLNFVFLFIIIPCYIFSQTLKGNVIDSESKIPVRFASIIIEKNTIIKTSESDSNGLFRFENLPIGRYDMIVKCVGYETTIVRELLVTSGKQLDVQITLIPKIKTLSEIIVKPENQIINTPSTHTLSIDQTNRYAATWGDVARMAMSFAGVNSVGDQSNELVIRGNSPKGLLWMIEGVEVPSPNHFSSEGASGGLISALNTAVLRNSTFYTGAFPANYGNATSGVFDIRLRNGNNEKRESNFTFGLLGIDVGSEGPFSKKYKSSYLFNYRFANTQFIKSLGLVNVLRVATPKFQDLTFKVNFPFRKANLSVWGIGGKNVTNFTLQSFLQADNRANFYASGANLAIQLNKNIFWETILSFSGNETINNYRELSSNQTESKTSELSYSFLRLSTNFTKKISQNNTAQFGTILSQKNYRLQGESEELFFINQKPYLTGNQNLNNKGSTFFLQGYFLWRKRTNKTTLTTGLHSSLFMLNKKYTIEPRVSLNHQINKKVFFNVGLGLHSRLEPISVYLFENNFTLNGAPANSNFKINNKNLDITKSFHSVIGLTYLPNDKWRINSEIYYQHLFSVGVGDSTMLKGVGYLSLINQLNSTTVDPWIAKGKGENYGWELTVERNLNKGIYCLFTSSVFRSMYSTLEGNNLPSRFDNRFVFNFLAGKEWQIGKNLLNINIRNTWAGGIRMRPVSIRNGVPVTDYSQGYTSHLSNFYRLDFKINYILNFKKTTSTFSLDINNLTNRSNPLFRIYNSVTKQFETTYQLGLLPVVNYRLNF